MKELKNIKNILFDCDGVLYADLEGVFGQVSKKMTQYISNKLNVDLKEAKELQTNYFHKYNTSLNGLMIHHDIPPREFLDYVHDINLDFLEKDTALRNELENINLNKFVFTNGSKEHVKNITTHLGIEDQFDGVFDIVDAEYSPKPEAKAFDLMVKKFQIDPTETLYIEDIAKNLSIGKKRGAKTVWLINDEYWGKKESEQEYIDYKIENLSLFLKEIRLLKTHKIMSIEKIINEAWENKDQVGQNSDKSLKDAVNQIIDDLDSGKARVAEKINGEWVTHQHLKKAIMLSFRMYPMENLNGPYSSWYDKAHLLKGKTAGWTKEDHEKAGFRMVPNSPVRKGSFVGKNAVLMPCYVNIGAYIDEGTMMDTFSRAGSCCQIGKNCHISAGSGIGGVLEPAQALPTIIEDNVFVGAMSEVVEGVIVGEGSVLSMGMLITQSTKIVTRSTGEITYGKIPPYSVVVPGSLPDKNNPSAPSLSCAVIIKQVDEKTRSKTSVNDLLRD